MDRPLPLLLINLLLLVHELKCGSVWTKEDFPNPQTDPEKCGQDSKSWVCDPYGIIAESQVKYLNELINAISGMSCTCPESRTESCNYRIGVAVVPHIQVNGSSTADLTAKQQSSAAKQFALYLLNHSWKFGHCGEDMVILIDVRNKKPSNMFSMKFQSDLKYDVDCDYWDYTLLPNGKYGDYLIDKVKGYRSLLRGTCGDSFGISANTVGLIISCVAIVLGVVLCLCCCYFAKGCRSGGGNFNMDMEL